MNSKINNNPNLCKNDYKNKLSKSEKIDMSLIEFNLSLKVEERLLNHQNSLDTINELIKARKQIYGES